MDLLFADSLHALPEQDDQFLFSTILKRGAAYVVYPSGNSLHHADSIAYEIAVIPDRYPTIQLQQTMDSANKQFRFFSGEISDDYGLKNLQLKFRVTHANGKQDSSGDVRVGFSGKLNAVFSYTWDMSHVALQPGDQLTYYFEVWDNDGVNGSKATRSADMTFLCADY